MLMTYSHNLRLPKADKKYWLKQLAMYTSIHNEDIINEVSFGKQDTRGIPSITLIDKRGCVPSQKHFPTTRELLAYVKGYNEAYFTNTWDKAYWADKEHTKITN